VTTKHYAKNREPIGAAQWTGEMTTEVRDLLGGRAVNVVEARQLVLGSGWYASVGDWILSSSGEDLSVISDEVFRRRYEEVDEGGRAPSSAPPTDDEHEAAFQEFVGKLDALLVAALRLSPSSHPGIWRDRNALLAFSRRLLEDHSYVAARRERQRIKEKIVKDL